MGYRDMVRHPPEKVGHISLADKIAMRILDNLNCRKGYDAMWDELDEELREEIFNDIRGAVLTGLETMI